MRRSSVNRIALTALLAAGPARGHIVYTLPPVPITATSVTPESEASAPLDINNDGVPEFTIHAYQFTGLPWSGYGTYIRSDRQGAFFQWEEWFPPLPEGRAIGPPDDYNFSGRLPFSEWFGIAGDGEWEYNASPAFFGFRFEDGGASFFGWARAQITSTQSPRTFAVTVFDYAYESVAGAPILAGQVPSPGGTGPLLCAGFMLLRRRRT